MRRCEPVRDSSDLDTEWRFYILVASKIFAPSEGFGYMYHPTREALFMTSQHVFPEKRSAVGHLARPAFRYDGRVLPDRRA